MALGKITIVAAASFLLSKTINAETCECLLEWSSPTPGCEQVKGCPETSCDGVTKPWCKVRDPGCEQEARGEGWAWCEGKEGVDLDPAMAGNPDKTCKDIASDENGRFAGDASDSACYRAVSWAMNYGIDTKPEFYKNYTAEGLTKNSSRLDFQCALADMVGDDESGNGHHCPVPCHSTLPQCSEASSKAPPTTTTVAPSTTTTESSGSSSFPWWAWVLLACAILGIGAAVAYAMFKPKGTAPKKKKRATKTAKAAPAPTQEPAKAPEPAAPPVITAPPVYITTPQQAMPIYQTQATAAPMQFVTAAPTMAPTPTFAAPMTMSTAMPVQTMSVPIQQARPVTLPTFA